MTATAPKPALDQLSGLIERVTFHNADSGFCVLRLKVRGERDLVTLIGHTPTVTPGEYASASGNWVTDREHGRQFRAVFVKIAPPNTLSGIERYLGSGMVKGIGPIYASRLVEAFGTGVFDVIEQSPARLQEIDGIGKKRAKKITSGWADQKIIREIMVFLHAHGVSTSRGVRIFKTYRSGQSLPACTRHSRHRLPVGGHHRPEDRHCTGLAPARPGRRVVCAGRSVFARALRVAVRGIGAARSQAAADPRRCDRGRHQAGDRRRGGGAGHGGRGALRLSGTAVPSAACDRRAQAAQNGHARMPHCRRRQGDPVGREQARYFVGAEPARRRAPRARFEAARHHRRPRGRQDDSRQLDPDHPAGQAGQSSALRPHGSRRKTAVGIHRLGGQDDPPTARSRSAEWPVQAQQGFTTRLRPADCRRVFDDRCTARQSVAEGDRYALRGDLRRRRGSVALGRAGTVPH